MTHMATTPNDSGNVFYFKQDSCSIILKLGDLLTQKNVDAIVIPTPPSSEPNPDSFKIFKTFYNGVDEYFKKEIKRMRDDLVPTNAKMLFNNGNGFIFVATPYFSNPNKACEYLKKTYGSIFNLVAKHNLGKIAFPTIGCGTSGFSMYDATRIVHQTLGNFIQSRDGKQLNEVRIIVYDQRIWADFTSAFMDICDRHDSKIKNDNSPLRSLDTPDVSWERDRKQVSQDRWQNNEAKHRGSDFEDPSQNRSGDVRRQHSHLNPDSSEFQPNNRHLQKRPERRYHINNGKTELIIVQGDILTTKVDAIVNAANEMMLGGGGVDGVIHRAAGSELRQACKAHKEIERGVRLPLGRSRILLSYNLSPTTYYIINTSGPRYDDALPDKCKRDLTSCYETSLALANLYDLQTIGFTAISCGIFGYPVDEGAEVALKTVDKEADSMRKIWFVLLDDHIYDAWVKKAKELNFKSLDNHDTEPTDTSKSSANDTQNAVARSNINDESIQLKPRSRTNPTDNTQPLINSGKSSENPSLKHSLHRPPSTSQMAVIDGSTPITDEEKSKAERKKLPQTPNDESATSDTPGNAENINASKKDRDNQNSQSNKGDSPEKGTASNTPSKHNQPKGAGSNLQPSGAQKNPHQSIVQSSPKKNSNT